MYLEVGQKVWLPVSGTYVKEAVLTGLIGSTAMIRFSNGGRIQVRANRLCGTKKEAVNKVSRFPKKNQYDYMQYQN